MKGYRTPIDVIAVFDLKGEITPIRIRYQDCDETLAFNVDKSVNIDEDKHNRIHIFRCQSLIKGEIKVYEIMFNADSCKWCLYKI
jgi:hypothetical protein